MHPPTDQRFKCRWRCQTPPANTLTKYVSDGACDRAIPAGPDKMALCPLNEVMGAKPPSDCMNDTCTSNKTVQDCSQAQSTQDYEHGVLKCKKLCYE